MVYSNEDIWRGPRIGLTSKKVCIECPHCHFYPVVRKEYPGDLCLLCHKFIAIEQMKDFWDYLYQQKTKKKRNPREK